MTKNECEIETSKAIMEMRKRITELEKENAELKADRDYFSDALDKQIEATLELQKKYQELEEQIEKRGIK